MAERPLTQALIAEAWGTFVLTFIGPLAITVATNPGIFSGGVPLGLGFIGLAHGIALLVGIAAVAQVSGAHFNPAVTIGLTLGGKFPRSRVVPYIGAQLAGAVVAGVSQLALVGVAIAKTSDLGSTLPNGSLPDPILAAVIAETIGTCILVMTVLGSTDKDSLGWGSSAIGMSLAAVIWAVGGISGASLNPARSFGPAIISLAFSTKPLAEYWIYVLGPILGAVVAAQIYRAMSGR